jgi:Protein of unknown function (DUF2795)
MTSELNDDDNNNSYNNKTNEKSSKLEKKEQIPTEYNEEQTLRTIRKQDQIPGEGRGKTINDLPNTAALAQVLKNLDFLANKNKIIEFVRQRKFNEPKSNQILPVLEKIEEKQYQKLADVTLATKLVQ